MEPNCDKKISTRKPGVPSREEMYIILKNRSEQLKNGETRENFVK